MGERGTDRRIVVVVRFNPPVDPGARSQDRTQEWSELAPPLFERATALGGRVVGWGDRSLSLDFSWDALYDAIDFVVDAPLLPELATGVSHGHLQFVHEGPRMALAIGAALHHAEQLALLARAGEVLLDPTFVAACGGRLGSLGEPGKRPGRPDVPALVLDLENPLEEGHSIPPPPSQTLPLEELEFEPSTHVRAEQAARLAGATEAVGRESDSTFPEALSQALRERTPESLARLTEHVTAEQTKAGPPTPAIERLTAMTELLQGHPGEAIRRLRDAQKEAEGGSASERCRAALALAVAYGAVGRSREAILEALVGLARAREGSDERGERACARFLGRLAQGSHDDSSADAWNALCS